MIKYSNSVFKNEEEAKNFVWECEKNFEIQLLSVIEAVCMRVDLPFITLSGPTCSGKTTAAKKIVSELEKHSVKANIISIDDFYYDTQKLKEISDRKGNATIDYESIDTIDMAEFARFVDEIIDAKNKKVHCPVFDFTLGKRAGYRSIECSENSVFLFEGIQVLYPQIQSVLSERISSNIYICTESSIDISGKIFDPNEIRFLRRLVRDYNFRSTPPSFTFHIWESVRKNEEERIFPYSDLCDYRIDSVFACEISLLKPYLTNILSGFLQNKMYGKAAEDILNKISNVDVIPKDYISENSLYREFI